MQFVIRGEQLMNVSFENAHLYPYDDIQAYYDVEIDSFELTVEENALRLKKEEMVFRYVKSPWKDGA